MGREILVLERNPANLELIARAIREEGFEVLASPDRETFDQALDTGVQPLMALVDLAGLDVSIWQSFEKLRRQRIPILVVHSTTDAGAIGQSLARGATIVLQKPLSVRHFKDTVRSLVEALGGGPA